MQYLASTLHLSLTIRPATNVAKRQIHSGSLATWLESRFLKYPPNIKTANEVPFRWLYKKKKTKAIVKIKKTAANRWKIQSSKEYSWLRELKGSMCGEENVKRTKTVRVSQPSAKKRLPTSRWKLEKSNQLQWDDARVWIHGNRRRSRSWEIFKARKAPSAEVDPKNRLFSLYFIFRILFDFLCVLCTSAEKSIQQ